MYGPRQLGQLALGDREAVLLEVLVERLDRVAVLRDTSAQPVSEGETHDELIVMIADAHGHHAAVQPEPAADGQHLLVVLGEASEQLKSGIVDAPDTAAARAAQVSRSAPRPCRSPRLRRGCCTRPPSVHIVDGQSADVALRT